MQVVPALALALAVLSGAARGATAQYAPPDVRYRVSARIDDLSGTVTGSAQIRYLHRGSGQLESLLLRLTDDAVASASGDPHVLARDDPDAGFHQVDAATVGGVDVTLGVEPASDGLRARVALPRPLAAGDSVLLAIAWHGRPVAAGPRVDRRGRDLQLTGWYPLVLDEAAGTEVLAPAYGTHLVVLDVAEDQVIAAGGLTVCGVAARGPPVRRENPNALSAEFYGEPLDPAAARADCTGATRERRRVGLYAERVGELALALSPDFVHEEGDINERPVHAFYRRGGERVWGAGLTTRHTETALAWTDEILDFEKEYPWPQTTVVEALPGSAGAYPMVIFADTSSQSALLSLLGLMITEHMIGGGDRDLTRGTAAFQTAWFFDALGRSGNYETIEREILDWDLDRRASGEEPLGGPAPPSACRTTTCRRAEFTFHQLRRWVNHDELVRELYRRAVREYELQPIPARTFVRISRELIAPDPGMLYRQLLRGGALYDDAVRDVRREPVGDAWRTTLTVERRAAGIFPQTVWVIGESDTAAARATALTPRETLQITTRSRPLRVIVDPLVESHDWNMLDNEWRFDAAGRWLPWRWLPLRARAPLDNYVDNYLAQRVARDRLTRGWAPAAWYNDPGGWTGGVRVRENYLGRFERNEAWLAVSERAPGGQRVHGSLRLQNPVWLFRPRWSQALDLLALEGRAAAQLGVGYRFPTPVADSIMRSARLAARWLTVMDPAWVDPSQYDDAATAELVALLGESRIARRSRWSVEAEAAGGYAWPGAAPGAEDGGYGRVTLEGSARRDLVGRISVGARAFAGAAFAERRIPRQRLLFWSLPDTWDRLRDPLLRSRGAIMERDGFHYHDPGGIGVRGIAAGVASRRALGASLEAELALLRRPDNPLLRRAAIAAFGDAGAGDGDVAPDGSWETLADAGVGIRLEHHIGGTPFNTRIDLPLWISHPGLAQDDGDRRRLRMRWTFSLEPSF